MQIFNHNTHATPHSDIISYMMDCFKTLPHFTDINTKSIFQSFETDAKVLSPLLDFEDILILGIGGSSLGGQSLYPLRTKESPRLHFLDNIDPKSYNTLCQKLNPSKTGVVAISKSGNTAETLMQVALFKERFETELGDQWSKHFIILTEPIDSALSQFAKAYNIPMLNHHQGIGGRFCVFTNVGATIAYLCGFDFKAFHEGAATVLKMDPKILLEGATSIAHHYTNKKISQSVVFAYADAFETFTEWYAQLWGESLGKIKGEECIGITPIRALGTVDQHSHLQLYLDGPKDKFITIIGVKDLEKTEPVPDLSFNHPAWTALTGKCMDQLFMAMQNGTRDALLQKGCLVREIILDDISPFSLGQLMMFYMIETVATAYLLGINPFDQPGVESGKRNAMHYLEKCQ